MAARAVTGGVKVSGAVVLCVAGVTVAAGDVAAGDVAVAAVADRDGGVNVIMGVPAPCVVIGVLVGAEPIATTVTCPEIR